MALDPKLLADLNARREKNFNSGTPEKVAARHAKGQYTARERVSALVQDGISAVSVCDFDGLYQALFLDDHQPVLLY